MSRTSFRVNLHSIVCLNVKELLARGRRHIGSLKESIEIKGWLVVYELNGWVLVYELGGCGSNLVAVTYALFLRIRKHLLLNAEQNFKIKTVIALFWKS